MSAISAYSGYVPPTPQPASPNASPTKSVASGCSNCGSGSCQGCGDKLSTQTDSKDAFTLSDAEQKQVNELKVRDREVRAHEQAHKIAKQSINAFAHHDMLCCDTVMRGKRVA